MSLSIQRRTNSCRLLSPAVSPAVRRRNWQSRRLHRSALTSGRIFRSSGSVSSPRMFSMLKSRKTSAISPGCLLPASNRRQAAVGQQNRADDAPGVTRRILRRIAAGNLGRRGWAGRTAPSLEWKARRSSGQGVQRGRRASRRTHPRAISRDPVPKRTIVPGSGVAALVSAESE
jgi:hypothetical protein